jgi:hypothetical protein
MEIKKICYCGELDRTPFAPDHLGIRQGLEHWEGYVVDPVLHGIGNAIERVRDIKPDLLIHGNTDTLGVASQFRPYCKYQVFWMLDYQPTIEQYGWWNEWTKDRGQFDALFISNEDQIDDWKNAFDCPTFYLPHGCVVKPLKKDPEHKHGCVFIGSISEGGWYNDRAELLREIGFENFTHINGDGVDGRNQVWKDMPFIYHTSDCVLDISHTWKAVGYASGRYFYSAGLGGCSITRKFPKCEELYPKGCKAYFESPEEARELIEFYKTHEKEREKMKLNAWKHNKKFHNYKLRFNQMIKCLS